MRISKGGKVIGDWSVTQIRRSIEEGSLDPTDLYYDEDSSDWLPIATFIAKQAAVKADRDALRPCYCGSGLPFPMCHGDGTQY